MFKKLLFSLTIVFATIFSLPSFADTVDDVEKYLNNIKYFKANFVQDDITNSSLSEGIFYLSRPGKLRLDYLNPFRASLYTDNRTTIYYDKELDEVNSIRTASTPLQFLLRSKISFKNNDFKIINTEEDRENIHISFQETGKKDQGTLILKFKKNPIELSSITLINGAEQSVEVMLFNISTAPIDKKIFVFKSK